MSLDSNLWFVSLVGLIRITIPFSFVFLVIIFGRRIFPGEYFLNEVYFRPSSTYRKEFLKQRRSGEWLNG